MKPESVKIRRGLDGRPRQPASPTLVSIQADSQQVPLSESLPLIIQFHCACCTGSHLIIPTTL